MFHYWTLNIWKWNMTYDVMIYIYDPEFHKHGEQI